MYPSFTIYPQKCEFQNVKRGQENNPKHKATLVEKKF